jgi:hypothetical protein
MATDKTAYIVHIKKAQLHSAAGYMSKYMTKQSILSNQFKRYERRYTFSRKFPRLTIVKATESWSFVYKPNNINYMKTLSDHITIVKARKLQALREIQEIFPDIYKKWRADYDRKFNGEV